MSVKSAFNLVLSIHAKAMTLKRLGPSPLTVTVKMAPSNYFRNLEGPSETVVQGREFVVSKDSLDAVAFPRPIRGDRIVDTDFGTMTISEVREMVDLGSATIGYRIRVA